MLKVCLKVEASKTLENYYETLPDIIKTYLGKLTRPSPNFKSKICQSGPGCLNDIDYPIPPHPEHVHT